jgi:hypothetical protein
MTVQDLIELLQRIDPSGTLPVRLWDGDADEYMPVTGAIFEDGSTGIDLLSDIDLLREADDAGDDDRDDIDDAGDGGNDAA